MKITYHNNSNTELFAATLLQTTPEGCELKIGDIVTFINDYGIPFPGKEVIGYRDLSTEIDRAAAWRPDNIIHIDTDAYWFPHNAGELIKESEAEGQARLQQWIKDNPDKVTRY